MSQIEPGRAFDLGVSGLMPMSVIHEIEALPAGRSRVTVKVIGPGGGGVGPGFLLGWLLGRPGRLFAKHDAQGLKRRAEAEG